MKRIFTILLSLIFFYSMAQTEIWGVKSMAGKADGGILFKIDSATNQIEVKHRFTAYPQEYRGQGLVELSNPNQYMGIIGNEIVKVDIETGEKSQQFIYPNYTKNLVYAADGQVYYVTWDSLVSINPADMSIEKWGRNLYAYPISKNPYDDNKLVVWASNKVLSYLNLTSMELENLYEIPNYNVVGPAAFDQNKMYFLGSAKDNGWMKLIIFSYDMESNSYLEEFTLINDSLEYHWGIEWLSGLVCDADQMLYGAGKVVAGDDNYYMFAYNTALSEFQILAPFPEEIGGGSVGYLSIKDNMIYSNTNSGAAQGLGSIFSFNISNHQFELLHVYDTLHHFETNSHLTLNSEGNLIGITPEFGEIINRKVFSLNTNNPGIEDIFNITYEVDPTEGCYPGDFVRTKNGNIYGYAGISNLGENTSGYGSVFYKYNIQTENYQKLFIVKDQFPSEAGIRNLFNETDGNILGFTYGYDSSEYCRSFDFNVETDEIEFVSNEKYRVQSWVQESDQTYIGIAYGKPILYRYNSLIHKLDTLYEHHEGYLSNPVLDIQGNLICNLKKNNFNSDFDSLFIVKYNFDSKSFSVLGDMNQFVNEDVNSGDPIYRSLNFKFVYNPFNGEKLIGDYWQWEAYGKWYTSYHRLINLDLNTFEIEEYEATGSNTSKYCFVDDYSNEGSVYMMNEYDHYQSSNWDCGFLRKFDPINEEILVLDQFEKMTTWYEYDDGDEPQGFKLLKKFDLSATIGIQEIKVSAIRVFASIGLLSIESEQQIQNAQITVFDLSGRQVDEFTAHNFTQTSRQLHLNRGVYLVNIASENIHESFKIMVD